MRILNLYAGIGGNRKLWGDEHEITAVENVPYIAEAYRKLFPEDTVIVADAHQYLLDHHKEFDFIWSSPPCPTHSKMNRALYPQGWVRYPDMTLYQEILFLKHFFKCKWVVENVDSYYDPLIVPQIIDRHYFWSNFYISRTDTGRAFNVVKSEHEVLSAGLDIDITFMPRKYRRQVLRNAVDPKLGLHILNAAQATIRQLELVEGALKK